MFSQSALNGTVRSSEDHEPIPGVSILIKGTTIGVTTDFNGNYTINASPTDVLVFQYLGFTTLEKLVGNNLSINVVLASSSEQLNDVVVIGYGTAKRADLTGSVSTVKGEDLARTASPNLQQALAGKVAGVITMQASGQPGYDGATVSVRGTSTLNNSSALYIVDGVQRSYSRIDPQDIESINVLKDAASTAIYGASGANGVILITTKRGKTGEAVFSYNGSYGFQSQTRRMELMNSGEYARYRSEGSENDGKGPLFTPEQIKAYENGPSYNWMDALFSNNTPIQKHSITARGGNEKTKYFLSFGTLDQEGFYKTSNYNQKNLRSNLDVVLTDNLDLNVDLSGRMEDRMSSSAGSYQHLVFSLPFHSPFATEVGPDALGYNGYVGNPIGDFVRSGTNNHKTNRFESTFKLTYKLPWIKGLSANALYSYDVTNVSQKIFKYPYEYYKLDVNNNYQPEQGGPSTTSLKEKRTFFSRNTMQLSLRYAKDFGDHSLGVLALLEESETRSNFLTGYRDDFISNTIPELFVGAPENWKNNGGADHTAKRGFVTRVTYDYKNTYLFQANMRIDESYKFPKKGRTGYFPAVSAAWKVSNEDFMKDIDAISSLKLRTSYGLVGNDRVDPYQFVASYLIDGGSVTDGNFNTGIRVSGVANPNITWEKAKAFNIGINLGILDNRLTFEFDYFKKRTEDILFANSAAVPDSFGAKLPDENFGIVDSWGSEGIVTYRNTFGGLKVNVSANYSWYDNEIINIREPSDILPGLAKQGRSTGLRYGYLSDGLFQTTSQIEAAPIQFNKVFHKNLVPGDIIYQDINGRDENGALTGKPDGKVNSDDQTVIGSSGNANFVYGLNINLGYKGFDMTASFQGAGDFSRYIDPFSFARDGNALKELTDSWRVGNEDAKYPRLTATGDATVNATVKSDYWVTEVNYLRLRSLNLGYSFPGLKNTFTKIGMSSLRMYVSGSNLFTLSNLGWRDPEGGSGRDPFYPQVKTISLGLNVNF